MLRPTYDWPDWTLVSLTRPLTSQHVTACSVISHHMGGKGLESLDHFACTNGMLWHYIKWKSQGKNVLPWKECNINWDNYVLYCYIPHTQLWKLYGGITKGFPATGRKGENALWPRTKFWKQFIAKWTTSTLSSEKITIAMISLAVFKLRQSSDISPPVRSHCKQSRPGRSEVCKTNQTQPY